MTRPLLSARLEVMACNIETHKASPQLLAQIRKHDPDVVIVEQAYRARRWLRGIKGYRHFQPWGSEAKGIAVLVHDGVRVQRRRSLRMKMSWTGPKAGRRHKPRVYPALVLVKSGVTFRVIGIHLPSHNNPAAQGESMSAVARYFREHPNSPLIAAGDWNREEHELEQLADSVGAVVLTSKTKVDHALVRGASTTSSQRLPTPEGAHGWARYTIEASREN